MARGKSIFRKVDVARAVKGALDAGLEINRVEIDQQGKIVLLAGPHTTEPASQLEKWKQDRARAS